MTGRGDSPSHRGVCLWPLKDRFDRLPVPVVPTGGTTNTSLRAPIPVGMKTRTLKTLWHGNVCDGPGYDRVWGGYFHGWLGLCRGELDLCRLRLGLYLDPGGRDRGIARVLLDGGLAVSVLLSFTDEQAGVSLPGLIVVTEDVPGRRPHIFDPLSQVLCRPVAKVSHFKGRGGRRRDVSLEYSRRRISGIMDELDLPRVRKG